MEHLRKFVDYIREKNPELQIRASEEMFGMLEEKLLPHILRVIQRDDTLFSEVELFPGLKWDGSEEAWKRLQMAFMYSILHGDPKEKFGKILETVKTLIPGGSAQADEIQNLLNDEETQSSLKEMLELVMNTRLASLVGEIAQTLTTSDLNIDFENPEKLLEMLRNPQESPVLQEIADRAQQILKDKIATGKINQQELVREIETLRAKFQSSFGRYLNETLIGQEGPRTGNTSAQILSNHPDARRARMLARLQKKQKEKELRK
jgi:hypothetical protein